MATYPPRLLGGGTAWLKKNKQKNQNPDKKHTLNRNHYNCCNFSPQEILCILINFNFICLLKEYNL